MTDTRQTIEEQANGTAAAPADNAGPAAPSAHDAGPVAQPPTSDAEGAEAASEVEGDLDELVRVAAQRDEYLALAQRTQADFENYRKRVARESAAAQERGVAKFAKELLPALDNLDRALEDAGNAAPASGHTPQRTGSQSVACAQDDPLLEGVRLVRAELSAALARMGIESFSPVGETFDPAEHEAMAQHSVDGAESGTVVEVYQPGYRLGASIIRPARVVVAA
jgi:molecular chaperone GrpE